MGYMPMAQRRSVLAAFKTDPNVRCILMSLKAGGEGLNLQEASHVLVLEPWWNPQVDQPLSALSVVTCALTRSPWCGFPG